VLSPGSCLQHPPVTPQPGARPRSTWGHGLWTRSLGSHLCSCDLMCQDQRGRAWVYVPEGRARLWTSGAGCCRGLGCRRSSRIGPLKGGRRMLLLAALRRLGRRLGDGAAPGEDGLAEPSACGDWAGSFHLDSSGEEASWHLPRHLRHRGPSWPSSLGCCPSLGSDSCHCPERTEGAQWVRRLNREIPGARAVPSLAPSLLLELLLVMCGKQTPQSVRL